MEYGTVISTLEGPSTRRFSFVINKDTVVRRGQFVQLGVSGGQLIGRVADVRKTNRYFLNPESVKNVEDAGSMAESFPTSEWEYLVADVNSLGVFTGSGFADANFPPSPGEKVNEPKEDVLRRFFGLDNVGGLHIGGLDHHELEVRLNLTRLLQKHLAILAMSGAGKSFLMANVIEELLERKENDGQIAAVVVDTHGEYTSFADDPSYSNRVKVVPIEELKIGLSGIGKHRLAELASLSGPQARELGKVLSSMKPPFTIKELISAVEESVEGKTKEVLLSALESLKELGIFGARDSPDIRDMAKQGFLTVIDMSGTISMKKKRLAVAHAASKLFEGRRGGKVPPFLLILEEAHQYVPEKERKEHAICRGILQTIAREGRKFHAALCLISQRPVQLSTTILSQCNTNIILRVTNPYDLKHIGESSEGITKDVQDQISSLQVGTGLVVGEAVNFPLFVRIRNRKSKESEKGMPLDRAALQYSKESEQRKKDAKQFM
jgi:DNA helicase HerA-like ATPase